VMHDADQVGGVEAVASPNPPRQATACGTGLPSTSTEV
jgi:hypothetical protein